jgi:nucleoside-diphosphate-sugar epimerase
MSPDALQFLPVDGQPWLIVGAGYTGEATARRLLAAGARVTVTRRALADAEATAARLAAAVPGAAVRGAAASLGDRGSLAAVLEPGAIVVDTAPPADGAGSAEAALAEAAGDAGARRLVYVSSTGVYAPAAGAWVDEEFAVDPAGDQGRRRLAAERALLETAAARGLEAVALRAAGIWGPDRGVAARLRAGSYRIIGDGRAHVSRIHVDDLAAALVAAGTVVPLVRAIYNAADDHPTPAGDHARALAAALGLPPPPEVPLSAVDPSTASMFTADRRISNRRLKAELGVVLAHPGTAPEV